HFQGVEVKGADDQRSAPRHRLLAHRVDLERPGGNLGVQDLLHTDCDVHPLVLLPAGALPPPAVLGVPRGWWGRRRRPVGAAAAPMSHFDNPFNNTSRKSSVISCGDMRPVAAYHWDSQLHAPRMSSAATAGSTALNSPASTPWRMRSVKRTR